jgi:hypothetical protein
MMILKECTMYTASIIRVVIVTSDASVYSNDSAQRYVPERCIFMLTAVAIWNLTYFYAFITDVFGT